MATITSRARRDPRSVSTTTGEPSRSARARDSSNTKLPLAVDRAGKALHVSHRVELRLIVKADGSLDRERQRHIGGKDGGKAEPGGQSRLIPDEASGPRRFPRR